MVIRVGFLSVAHMHAWGYASALLRTPDAQLVGVWDEETARAASFAGTHRIEAFDSAEALLAAVDAVVVTSENKKHADLVELAAARGKPILCEKPLVTSEAEGERVLEAVQKHGVKLMTAFPCRFSPSFGSLVRHARAGDVGEIRAISATNRGCCPFGWFVEREHSGGGAMIDHVVHVADLLRVLLGKDPTTVQAQVGNNMYGQPWEDTAMLTLGYEGGLFATLDSSWSRPKSYKTWGDVTMNVVGDEGVLELNMFAQSFDVYTEGKATHTVAGFGSDLDLELVSTFVDSVARKVEPPVTALDGLQAARVALAGYESVRQGGAVVTL